MTGFLKHPNGLMIPTNPDGTFATNKRVQDYKFGYIINKSAESSDEWTATPLKRIKSPGEPGMGDWIDATHNSFPDTWLYYTDDQIIEEDERSVDLAWERVDSGKSVANQYALIKCGGKDVSGLREKILGSLADQIGASSTSRGDFGDRGFNFNAGIEAQNQVIGAKI